MAVWGDAPVTITSGVNDRLDFAVESVPLVAWIAAGTYNVPALLGTVRSAMQAGMGGALPGVSMLVDLDLYSRVRFQASDGTEFDPSGGRSMRLDFGTGPNASRSVGPSLGFDPINYAGFYINGIRPLAAGAWCPGVPPADDTGDLAQHARAQGVSLSGRVRGLHFGTSYTRALRFEHLQGHKVFVADEGAAHVGEAFERFLAGGWSRFLWVPDSAAPMVAAEYAFDLDSAKALPRERLSRGLARYSLSLKFRKL
jgi:hypothetical protein